LDLIGKINVALTHFPTASRIICTKKGIGTFDDEDDDFIVTFNADFSWQKFGRKDFFDDLHYFKRFYSSAIPKRIIRLSIPSG
jgi:hypothetical protein